MNIFNQIKKLNFPLGKYVVVGGAAMAARGIKNTRDIDIVVTPDLFEKCKREGWRPKLKPNGEIGLQKGIVEVYLDVNCGDFNPTTEYLIQSSEIINGILFLNLKNVIRFKKEYGKEKDARDIGLIEKYLEAQESNVCR